MLSRDISRRLLYGLAVALVWTALLWLFNLWPGYLPARSAWFIELGLVECFARQGPWALTCDAMGYPGTYPVAFGLPLAVLKGWAARALPVTTIQAAIGVEAAMLLLALTGTILLLRHLGFRWWTSLAGAYLFMSSPLVYGQDGYGALRMSFALVPSYVWVSERFRAAVSAPARRTAAVVIGWALAVVASRVVGLFMDGYGFVMALALSAALFLPWAWRRWQAQDRTAIALGVSVLGGSTAAAYVLYTRYFPGASDFVVMPPELFRGQGVDVFVLLVPSWRFLAASTLGWAHTVDPWRAYTDGPPVTDPYLGFMMLLGAAAGLAWGMGRTTASGPARGFVVLAGLVALVLATGPALKVADFREPGSLDFAQLEDTYHMPADAATLDLGTSWIYQHVPAIKTMRALYRWHLLVRIALIVGFLAGIEALIGRGRRGRFAAAALVIGAAVELAPNTRIIAEAGRYSRSMVAAFDSEVVEPLIASTRPGDRVLLEPCHTTAPHNDYLASYLCGRASLRCYNAAGDKAVAAVTPGWPIEAERIMGNNYDRVLTDLGLLFDRNELDAVVFTQFGLWEDAYAWPPPAARAEQTLQACRALLGPFAGPFDAGWISVLQGAQVRRLLERPPAPPAPEGASPDPRGDVD